MRITGGQQGIKLTAVFHDALRITWRLQRDPSEDQPPTEFTLSPHGCAPANVIASCRLLRQTVTCHQMEIIVRGSAHRLTAQETPGDPPAEADAVLTTAEDLEVVQRETDTYFNYPDTVTDLDRTHLRVCRMLSEGKTTLAPTAFRLEAELDDPPPDTLVPGAIWLEGQQIPFRVADHDLVLRGITVWHPNGWIEPVTDSQRTYVLQPADERFLLSPDGAETPPEPWGLTDVPEPQMPAIPDDLFPAG